MKVNGLCRRLTQFVKVPFIVPKPCQIWLLTIYSKNEVENIPAHVLRQIAKEIENV
jgi:hypothetical protein